MKRLLLACVPTAVRRSRACVLLLALTASLSTVSAALPTPASDTLYLFVPGHGLTGRTTGNPGKTLTEVIQEAKNINDDVGGNYRPKIRFVEKEYTWAQLQPNSSETSINIDQLEDDLQECYEAGLYLRVFLSTHKYKESFPLWIYDPNPDDDIPAIPTNNNLHTRMVKSGPSGDVPMVRLNTTPTYTLLKTLYQKVVEKIKALDTAKKKTFYGFVLQEPNTGRQGPDPLLWDFSPEETNYWFINLRKLHDDLAFELKNVQTQIATGVKNHRLFWQMINYPDNQTEAIVTEMPVGGGLCGPDTFPGEPHPQNNQAQTLEWGLANAYDEIRIASQTPSPAYSKPTSLHVYALNYNKPYQGGPFVPPADQPIYRDVDSDNDNGLGTHDGIANFLGCVPDPQVNSLKVNNVVWSLAEGPTVDDPNTSYDDRWTGWSRVKVWMTTDQAVSGDYGGCNPTTPASLKIIP